jgi:two-component system, OmpR family, response regulator
MKLLLIEDELALSEALTALLRSEGFAVDPVARLQMAETALTVSAYDGVLLDLYLPDGDGMAWLRRLRARGDTTPVIIMTARDQVSDRIAGLQSGADDYVIKPFDVQELLARLGAVLRRAQGSASSWLQVGSLALDLQGRRARVDAQDIELTAKEWAVLEKLASRPGRIVNKEALDQALYSFDDDVGSNTLEVYISRIRKKIGKHRVETLRGLGYRLVEGDQP